MRWLALLVLAIGIAEAGPSVEIRAQSELSFTSAKKRDDGMVLVTGRLLDKLTRDGLKGQRVYVTIRGERYDVTTQDDGSFSIEVPAGDGEVEIGLSYQGEQRMEKAAPLTVTTDPTKSSVELTIAEIADVPAGKKFVVVAKTEDSQQVTVPIELSFGRADEDQLKPLRTDETGREFTVTRKELGGAGQHRMRAKFIGDEMLQAASHTVTITLESNTTTTMSLSSRTLAFEDDLVVSGRVLDEDQAPVARAAVTLMSGDRRLAQGATTEQGNFRFEVEGEVIGQGQFGVQVQADPGKAFIRSSRSMPEIVRVAAPQPVPVSYTIAAFLATALAAGGFFAARNKPWRRLRRPAPPAEMPSEEGEIAQEAGGLVVAKPGVVATLRRPSDEGFSGVVRDTVRGRPVDGAVVILVLGDQERSIRTGLDGSFTIDRLAHGEWRAEVAAPGHVTERFGVTIPHRGELRGVRIDLVPVRERVFQLYRRAAEPILPESRLWGIWSPRQIVDHVRSKRPSPALAELTDFVEEIYFSPRLAGETVLAQASERVDRAIHERTRR